MKKYLCSVGAWVALAAMTASGQTSSSGGSQSTSGSTQGTTSSSQGTSSSSQSTTSGGQGTSGSQGTLPPGLQNRNELPPGLQNRDQLPPGLAKRTNAVSNFGGTTNQNFGATNQFGGTAGNTNNSGLYPTGRSSNTNRTYATNSNSRGSSSYGTNSNSYGTRNDRDQRQARDEAVSPSDQKLLVTVREKVQTQVREISSAAGAWAPVHFRIHDGIVTIIGAVQTIEIKQRIETCVRQVPGVIRVEDTIEVAGGGGGGGDSDQVLLTKVRETVLPQIQVSGIDFQCHGGVVTVIGTVPQEEQKQRLVALVRQVPGVVNVTDQVTVNAEFKGQAESGRRESSRTESGQSVSGQAQTGRTEAGQPESNRAINAAVETSKTNLPPTGRTNSLPPGLEKKDQLPPGLQNRDQSPPGLSKGTNSAAQPKP